MVFSKDEEIFMVLEFARGNGPTAVKRACIRKFGPEMNHFQEFLNDSLTLELGIGNINDQ